LSKNLKKYPNLWTFSGFLVECAGWINFGGGGLSGGLTFGGFGGILQA
jgi:hypothetical protein